MKEITVRLTGTSPLLMHSTRGMQESPREGLKQKGDNLTGRDEAELGTYRDQNNGIVFPTIAPRNAMFKAASGQKVGKLTARQALGGVIPVEELVPVIDPETGEQLDDFEVDTRVVRIGNARIFRSRPRFENWAIEFALEYDELLINEQAICELLEKAGKVSGIGDYRPEHSGTFGRFTVSVVE